MNININLDPWHALLAVTSIFSLISFILCMMYRVVLKRLTQIVYGQTKVIQEFMAAKLTNSNLSVQDIANVLKANIQPKQEQGSNPKLKQ